MPNPIAPNGRPYGGKGTVITVKISKVASGKCAICGKLNKRRKCFQGAEQTHINPPSVHLDMYNRIYKNIRRAADNWIPDFNCFGQHKI